MTWWRFEEMPESHWGHRWLARAAIVMIVFPVLMLALLQAWKLLLLTLASVVPATTWGSIAVVVGTVLAFAGSFALCRMIWPR